MFCRGHPLRVAALFLFVSVGSTWAGGPPVVVAVPAEGQGLVRIHQWVPIVSVLRAASGIDTKLEMVKDQAGIKSGIEKNLYDIAFVDPIWVVILEREHLCVPLVRVVIGGTSVYRSQLIVRKDSIIRSIRDLAGKLIALPSRFDSGAGYFVPLQMLARHYAGNLEPAPRFVYSDSSLSVLKAVSYGKADAGFVSSSALGNPNQSELLSQVRVVLESRAIPQWTVVARRGLRSDIVSALQKSLLEMDTSSAGESALSKAGFDGFTETAKEDYGTAQGYYESVDRTFATPQ